MNKLIWTLTLHERTDRDEIGDALTADDDVRIVVLSDYTSLKAESNILHVSDFSSTEKTALYRILDKGSQLYEMSAKIVVVKKDGKTFNLEDSFVRDTEAVVKVDRTVLPDETPIKLRLEIPGFASNNFRELELLYNSDFSTEAIGLADELGISITGNGAEFTIDNSVECKISFHAPDGLEASYVIDFPEAKDVIAP